MKPDHMGADRRNSGATPQARGSRLLLASTIAAALANMSTAHAQSAPVGKASKPAVEEIVVSAQRRTESIKSVPISMTAITPRQLEQLNIKTIDAIQTITPGLTFNTGLTFAQNYIRGIGTPYAQPGLESAVATYIDGSYSPHSLGSVFDLLDIKSIQVLKGPQGTLYGRNATGGAILVNTADPTDKPEFHFATEYGSFNHDLVSLIANVPITDTLAIRVAAEQSRQDGYIRNLYDNTLFGGTSTYTLRGKVKWAPMQNFSAVASIQYDHSSDHAAAGAERIGAPGCLPCGIPGANVTPITNFFEADNDINSAFKTRTTLVNLHLQYQAGIFKLDSVSAYRDQRFHGWADEDFSPIPLFNYETAASGGRTFTQDVTLSTQAKYWLNGLIGVSYVDDDSYQDAVLAGESFTSLYTLTGAYPANYGHYATQSTSVYAESYIQPIERLKITLGGRYTHDGRVMSGYDNPAALLALAPPGSPASFGASASFNSFTPRAVIAYDTGPVNLYASYNRGFKAGGFNSPSFTVPNTIKPEIINSYEIGAKYASADHRIQLNAAAFYYNYKDLQVSITDLATGGASTENAASAVGKGVELDGTFNVLDWLGLTAGGSYLSATYSKFPDASVQILTPGGLATGAEDLAGSALTRAPKWTFYAAANATVPIGANWTGRLSGVLRYSSSYLFYPGAGGNIGFDRQPGYTTLNLTGSVGPASDRYRIGFYVNNALDTHYYVLRQTTAPFGSFDIVAAPITFGLRLEYNF